MEVQLSTEQEAEPARIARETDRSTKVLAREAVDRYLVEEVRILAAVRAGRDRAAWGEIVETSAVWARADRALRA